MKSYEETTKELLERREQYIQEKKRKRKFWGIYLPVLFVVAAAAFVLTYKFMDGKNSGETGKVSIVDTVNEPGNDNSASKDIIQGEAGNSGKDVGNPDGSGNNSGENDSKPGENNKSGDNNPGEGKNNRGSNENNTDSEKDKPDGGKTADKPEGSGNENQGNESVPGDDARNKYVIEGERYVTYSALNSYVQTLTAEEIAKISVDDKLRKALTDFTAKAVNELYQKSEGNFSCSPVSLYYLLSLVGDVADEEDISDLYALLGVNDRLEMESFAKQILSTITIDEGEDSTITKMANSLWIDDGFPLDETGKSVVDHASEAMQADIYNLDLLTSGNIDLMNDWADKNTSGMIKEIPFEPTDQTEMLLFNSLYFSRVWGKGVRQAHRFRMNIKFKTADGEIESDFISIKSGKDEGSRFGGRFLKNEKVEAAAVEYSDGSYIILIKPDNETDLDGVIANELGNIIEAFKEEKLADDLYADFIELTFPPFDYISKNEEIDKTIKDMGVSSLFTPGCFEKLDSASASGDDGASKLALDRVAQSAHIILDENGTKAGTITEASVTKSMSDFHLFIDSEFAYVIMSANDIPLFVGAVKNPAEH